MQRSRERRIKRVSKTSAGFYHPGPHYDIDIHIMKLNPHLVFNAECEAAFRFYEQCLGGRIVTLLKWSDSPMAAQAPRGWGDKILHATLVAGDAVLVGSDAMPGQYEKPKGFLMLLGIDDPADTERI